MESANPVPRLASLQLRGNKLSGAIPVELGNASDLARLDLSMNALTGSIPAALGNATDLAELRLGGGAVHVVNPVVTRSFKSAWFQPLNRYIVISWF